MQSASDLYGATSNEVTQTANAWDAVGVGGGTAPAAAATTTTAVASVYKVASNNNNVLVNFNSKTTDVRTVELISVTGKKVAAKSAKVVEGTNNLEIAFPSNAQSGVYLVVVNGQKAGSVIKK